MGDHETPQYELRNSFRPPRHVNTSPSSPSSTAYHGAAASCTTPTIRLDHDDGFEDVRLKEPAKPLPDAREGLGSKWLSSLSTANPTAAALSRSGTALHSRAKSWAASFPKLNTANISTSPEKADKAGNRQSKIFGDLFNGESAPVHLGVPTSPTKEESEFVMEYKSGFTERPSSRRKDSPTTIAAAKPNTAKTSWFTRKPSMPAPVTPASAAQDEFVAMNINTSLFPHGPADELSPQAFNDLLLNATNLLQRMQAAYKEKVDYIDNVQPEIDAQKEEVEEVETRSKHLKMQLEDIGRQNQEQKQVNEELIIQLAEEKMKLQEAREASKTIRLVRRETDGTEAGASDDEVAQRRKRRSAGSASDSGFESDADTSSVFSGGMETPVSQRHPQLMLTPDMDVTPSKHGQLFSRSSTMSQQSTAFSNTNRMGPESAAWATVEQLRHENQALRMQVEEMQSSLQGVIDFVGGVNGV
ncbi:hypothetical protein M409DRAFT_57460 [Zasmidium cellare ATCC 36951]|uniref:Uncharacterized protein n=1 Tax=Zasmidium cellare ATCC 36951 TaxID=1080233 RepID=A0A6A6CBH4_ZASCE|nr:uncharacterized protein M409DRAFT_57460 [Zasmidium cellare ATCC 36951]KAF2163578.1 hypothetical protein M409DRAFT_57460 [Zasmidium cellare ATCC 36951]